MTDEGPRPLTILPAEYAGKARHDKDGVLRIGIDDGVVEIRLERSRGGIGWWDTGMVDVYVRRSASDLTVEEIIMARHDGPDNEELIAQQAEAARYPLGEKEYWRSVMVGKYLVGDDDHLMTDAEFESQYDD